MLCILEGKMLYSVYATVVYLYCITVLHIYIYILPHFVFIRFDPEIEIPTFKHQAQIYMLHGIHSI